MQIVGFDFLMLKQFCRIFSLNFEMSYYLRIYHINYQLLDRHYSKYAYPILVQYLC